MDCSNNQGRGETFQGRLDIILFSGELELMDGSISITSLLSVDRIMSSLEVEQELYFSGGDNKLL